MQKYMAILVFVLVLVLAQVQSKNHWNDIVPQGKEVDYKYEATVEAKTSTPHSFSSRFKFNGRLHIQSGQDNDLMVRLSNLNYTLDNRREAGHRETNFIPISENLISLTKPFRIMYDENGKWKNVGVEQNEPDYILNIKKAIATILQVDWNGSRLDSVKLHSFITKEPGLHGMEENYYNVIPTTNELRIEKMHHMQTTHHLYHNVIMNMKPIYCEADFEEPLSHDSQKVYVVERNQNKYLLKRMTSNGGMYYQPFNAESFAFYVYVTQEFEMISMHDIEEVMKLQQEDTLNTLEFVLTEANTPFEIIPDSDKPKLAPEANIMIKKLLDFVKEHKIDMSSPEFASCQLVNRLQRLLLHFDMLMLEDLHKLLLNTPTDNSLLTHIFHQMLPFVGTQSSIKFMIKLIQEKKVKDPVAIQLLQSMPFYVRFPTSELISDVDVLLKLDGVSLQVQKVAILSFSTLIQQAYSREHVQFHDYFPRTEEIRHLHSSHIDHLSDVIEKYMTLFINELKTTESLEMKYLYFDALFNMKVPHLLKNLKAAVNGEWWNDNNLRRKAILTLYSVIVTDPEARYELYWPIMTDRNLPTELRIMACYVIVMSQPSLSSMINMYWFMQTENDLDLYQFYYTYFESMSKTQNRCYHRTKLHAKQLMKYLRRPYSHSLTQFNKIDIINSKVRTSQSLSSFIIDTKETMVLQYTLGISTMNLNLRPFTFYLRVSGLQGRLLDDLKLNVENQSKLLNYDYLLQQILNLPKTDGVQIEIVLMKHGQIIYNNLIDKNNYDEQMKLFLDYHKCYLEQTVHIDYELFYKLSLPTDIGFPFQSESMFPIITRTFMNNKFDLKDKILSMNIDRRQKKMIYGASGLAIHNPIANVWQGITKETAFDSVIPIYLDMSLNMQQDVLKISWKRHKNSEEDIIAYKSYVTELVYINDYLRTNVLKKTSPHAEEWTSVAHDKQYRNNITVAQSEDYNVGYHRIVQVIDTEDYKSQEKISKLYHTYSLDSIPFLEYSLKNMQFNDNVLSRILTYTDWHNSFVRMHESGLKGVLLMVEPSKVNPVSSVDFSLRLSSEITKNTPLSILPIMKITLKGTYNLKREEKSVKIWDANLSWELNNGHTLNTLKAQLTRIIPGQTDYKICVDGTEKYTTTGMSGQLNILMGQAVEGKCSTDETSIDITMKGSQLPEQIAGLNNFESCHQQIHSMVENIPSYTCLTDKTSIRKYEIDVKSKNLPTEFQNKITSLIEFLKVKYHNHYDYDLQQTKTKVEENAIKLWMRFPVANDILDVQMFTKDHAYRLTGLPAKNFRNYLIYPDNLCYSNAHRFMHKYKLMNTCAANIKDLMNASRTILPNVVTEDWVLLVGDDLQNTQQGVWIKRTHNKLAVKVVSGMHILLVLPVSDKFMLTLDGKSLDRDKPLVSNEWLFLHVEEKSLIALSKISGAQLIYNTEEMLLEIPKDHTAAHGKCF